MTLPLEVSYTRIGRRGNKKIRSVTGIICPAMLNIRLSELGYAKLAPYIYVDLGDVDVDWSETSQSLELFLRSQSK